MTNDKESCKEFVEKVSRDLIDAGVPQDVISYKISGLWHRIADQIIQKTKEEIAKE